jgi:hypothetical protein
VLIFLRIKVKGDRTEEKGSLLRPSSYAGQAGFWVQGFKGSEVYRSRKRPRAKGTGQGAAEEKKVRRSEGK